jgi:hypothetical protein
MADRTKVYRAWAAAKTRCYDQNAKNYPDYGGRGITMCDEWAADPAAFARDMGEPPTPGHTLDRIDNDGPYAPGNCRWATRSEQARNRRSTRLFEHDGHAATLAEWSEITGITRSTLSMRIYHRGWDVGRAVTEPLRWGRKKSLA